MGGARQAIGNGDLIQKLRVQAGLTKGEMCRRARMGNWTLQKIEEGVIPVSFASIKKVADVLGVDQFSIRDWDAEQEEHQWNWDLDKLNRPVRERSGEIRRFARVDEPRLKRLREEAGLTPEQLAKRANVSNATIRKIEKQAGFGLLYRLDVIEKLSEALDEDITDREAMGQIERDAEGLEVSSDSLPGRVEVYGSAFRVARLRAHLSMGELAKQAGVALATVVRLENKGFPPPYTTSASRRMIVRLAAVLRIDATMLCRARQAADAAETLRAGFGELVK